MFLNSIGWREEGSKIFSASSLPTASFPTNCCCLVTELCPTLCDPWTVAPQAPLSMAFSRQEYWSGLPFPSPGDLPDPGVEPACQGLSHREALPTS